jgi:hypothetical protein
MKTSDMVSSFSGANTLFEVQQINGQTHREERRQQRGHREERHRREIKGATREADQGRSKQQIQRRTRSAPIRNVRGSKHIVKRDCSDD